MFEIIGVIGAVIEIGYKLTIFVAAWCIIQDYKERHPRHKDKYKDEEP